MSGYGIPATHVNNAEAVFEVDPSTGAALGSSGRGATVSFTRPNDTSAYTANDVVGNSTLASSALEFTNVAGSSGGDVILTTVSHEIDVSAIPSGMTSFTLHFYSITPPSGYADNAAFDLPSGDRAYYLGNANIGSPVDLGSTLYVVTTQINLQMTLTSSSLFAYLVTNGGYTPTAQAVKKVTVHTVRL